MRHHRLQQLAAMVAGQLQQFEEIPLNDSGGDYCSSISSGPTLYVAGRKDDKIFNLPKSGEATVKFRIRSKSVSFRENGDERYSTDIEIQSIDPKNLEAIVDSYGFADRTRDAGGRFSPGQSASVGDMADAYVKRKKEKALLAGAGAAGVVAAVASPKARQAIGTGAGRLLRRAM